MAHSDTPSRPAVVTRPHGPSTLDILFAGGSTAVFLAIMASVVGSLTVYFR